MSKRPLMILGTGSHVGKSILTAAFCRIFSDDGLRVAPFKAQNMALNSAATPDGREIGRAQALQAEAARVPACAEMNPVLIKPSTHTSSQVVVLGRVWGQVDASDYYRQRVEQLFPIVVDSYRKLAAQHELIVLEGAGSPAEINLKARDIVNLRMAQAAGAACLLVGDIDRGGVFASLLGTLELLDSGERPYIRAFLINKFRGDRALLEPGIRMIEERVGIPCAGVVPHLADLGLEEEDSVDLEYRPSAKRWAGDQQTGAGRALRIAVIALPHLANFTDFDALEAEPCVSLAYVRRPEELSAADVVIIPGSKQTLEDLAWLRSQGLADAVAKWQETSPAHVLVGVCGGMQILGETLEDVGGVESRTSQVAEGLGLLPIQTHLTKEKVTRRARGQLEAAVLGFEEQSVAGYEIHLGETTYLPGACPFATIQREGCPAEIRDGAVSGDGRIFGTYLHGLFHDDSFRHGFLRAVRRRCGLSEDAHFVPVSASRDARITRLAAHVRGNVDMQLIYSLLAE